MMMARESLAFQWFGRAADFHPPLFSLLTYFWAKLGESESFLRLLPVSWGMATVYLIYLISKSLFNQKIALLAGLFLAISPYHIFYSQEMRMYSLLAFLGTLSIYFLLKRNWLLYGLSVLLLLYTHYASVFLLVAQVIWILFYEKDSIKIFLVSLFFAFLFYLPWLPQFWHQLEAGENLLKILPGWEQVASLSAFKALPLTLVKFSLGRTTFENEFLYVGIALFLFLVLGIIFFNFFRKLDKDKIFLLNWFLTPLLLAIIVSFFVPLYQPFRLLFTIVPFLLILATDLALKEKKWQIVIMGSILLANFYGLFMYWTNPRFQRENWRGAVQLIESQNYADSVALFEFSAPFAPYQWYNQGKIEAQGVLPGLRATPEIVGEEMKRVTSGKDQIFLFQYLQGLTDPQKLVENWLTSHGYYQTKTYDFSGVGFVYNYSKIQ